VNCDALVLVRRLGHRQMFDRVLDFSVHFEKPVATGDAPDGTVAYTKDGHRVEFWNPSAD
jgi:hypothetical protein